MTTPEKTSERGFSFAIPLWWGILLVGWAGVAAGAIATLLPNKVLVALAFAVTAAAVVVAARLLAGPVERLVAETHAVARGHFARELDWTGPAEVLQAWRDLDRLRALLRQTLEELSRGSADVGTEARALADGVSRQSAVAARQSAAVAETSATAAQIAQTAKVAAVHADEVMQVAQQSEDLLGEGQQVLDRAVQTIRGLAEQVQTLSGALAESAQRSRHIGGIVAGVKELAEQTNMLALNASIEAVKAGERGKGFSVVAIEMGNLADQSRAAAAEVHGILAEIDKGTRTAIAVADEGAKRARGAMDLASEAGRAIHGLTQVIRDSSVAARQIANNTRQQGIGVEQIVAALGDISSASQEVVSATRAVEQATANLSLVAGRLGEVKPRSGEQERA